MNDEQIIIAVAELDGYTVNYREEGLSPHYLRYGGICGQEHMKYLTSRDAIIPVIEKLHPSLFEAVCANLLLDLMHYWDTERKLSVDWKNRNLVIMATIHATPRQLCVALLKATGKWKE